MNSRHYLATAALSLATAGTARAVTVDAAAPSDDKPPVRVAFSGTAPATPGTLTHQQPRAVATAAPSRTTEPGAGWLMAGGLATVGFVAWRRRV